MDFDLSEDQLALRAGAKELLDRHASPARIRQHTDSDALYDETLWEAMVDQGWLGVGLAAAAGGLDLGEIEVAVLLEELGRHAAPAPFLCTLLAIGACARAGRGDLVDVLLSGEQIGCVGWSKRAVAVSATTSGGRVTLTGRTDPAPYAPAASVAIVVAQHDGDRELFAVQLDDTVRPAREPSMDVTRPLGWLRFDDSPAERLGGRESVDQLCDHGAALTSAEMLGGAAAALDMAVEYAKDRVQFGRPIGSFQAVKHRCADMLVDVEGMRSSAYWAAWTLSSVDPDSSIAASTAKCWAGDASKRVMASALQVHGGIGFTWEHDLHFFLKRSQLDQLLFGDASYHRARLTELLRARIAAGGSVV